jgi:hypothetical protein
VPKGIYIRNFKPKFKPKICLKCGKEFKPIGGNQKYCKECIPIMDKERNRQWYEAHSEEMIKINDKWRKAHPDRVREGKKRRNDKRDRSLDFISLNKYFEGADAHHLDKTYVIYIPQEVHQSIRHSVLRNKNMDEINAIAFNYLP